MKNFVKLLFYLLAYLFHHNHDSKVVYYHDIGKKYTDMGTDFELFKKHISIIKKSGYEIVSSITLKEHQVMICFDDGWEGLYDYRSYFVENKIFPTIFIAVDLIGKEGYLTIEQIKDLYDLGFQFECHTWSHRSLPLFTGDDLVRELRDSKFHLEQLFNKPFNAICYPQGKFTHDVFDFCCQYGYTKQYTSICGGYFDLEDKQLICRNCTQFACPAIFFLMLNSTSSFFKNRFIKQHTGGELW